MFGIDDFHITRLDPILDFPRKRQHVDRVGAAVSVLLCVQVWWCLSHLSQIPWMLDPTHIPVRPTYLFLRCTEHVNGWAGLTRNAGLALETERFVGASKLPEEKSGLVS